MIKNSPIQEVNSQNISTAKLQTPTGGNVSNDVLSEYAEGVNKNADFSLKMAAMNIKLDHLGDDQKIIDQYA